jgi:hypothetical protein
MDIDDISAAAMRNFRCGSIDEWRDVLTANQIKSFEASSNRWSNILGGIVTHLLGAPAK